MDSKSQLNIVDFVLLFIVAVFFDSLQLLVGIVNLIPLVGTAVYLGISFMISIIAWLTFMVCFAIINGRSFYQSPAAMTRAIKNTKGRSVASAQSRRRAASELVHDPTKYLTRRVIIYCFTALTEMIIGLVPGFTLMIVALYATERAEIKMKKNIAGAGDYAVA
jgi:hypothetical protein